MAIDHRLSVRWKSSVAILLTAVAVLVAGCGGSGGGGDRLTTPAAQQAAPKNGTGVLRTDIEPLTKRFTALGSSFQAKWMSGTYGDPRNPGPSLYWIDAVVILDQAKVAELISAYAPTAAPGIPAVVDGLKPNLPSGPFHTSTALDEAFSQNVWDSHAYLDPKTNALVLVAQGT
ncbi:hypothetical protein [Saccharopolyspora sp. 5N708]|uniref:hypothetical protein n=1 Tax=Saccharopolyspora sp. 5N708 TaxID=3457424 RepID=UPI003FD1A968